MDKYKIDSHKINYHVDRLNDWLTAKKEVYPIYVEITPCGACNHRCSFCALDFIGHEKTLLDAKILKQRLSEMGEKGVRSVMFAGEGEPLLHKGLSEIINHAKEKALIDVAITTNAVPLTEKFCENTLRNISWIKASVNAGRRDIYSKIHQTKPEDFDRVIKNLEKAVIIRNKIKSKCVLGLQMVLLPENADSTFDLAKISKSIGLDYIVIKPYSQHKKSLTHKYEGIDYEEYTGIMDKINSLTDKKFQVVYRKHAMDKLKHKGQYYEKCLSVPYFWAYIMSNGDVYSCSAYLKDKRFCLGNINEKSFSVIWESGTREKNKELLKRSLDIKECRENCRMDEVNRYLWDLKHPPEHKNFI